MVPEKHSCRVAGLNQALQGATNTLGSMIGAFLIEVLPMQGVLGVDVLSAVIAILPLVLIAIPHPRKAGGALRLAFLQDRLEGWRIVVSWRGVLWIRVIAMLISFLLPIGLAMAGPLSDRFGANTWFLAGGIAAILLGDCVLPVPSIVTLEEHGGRSTAARATASGEEDRRRQPAHRRPGD